MFDKSTRVLIVDDMLTMRKLVGKICKDLGFTDLVEAADGNLAWSLLESSKPGIGLVISDWNMPNCSGLEFLRKIRGDGRFNAMPFLMVTAESEMSQVMEAVNAGVDNYVVKPFTKEILTEKLAVIYKKRGKPAAQAAK